MTSNNAKKTRISALCLGLLFVLTTVIMLIASPLRNAYAKVSAELPTLKFRQIAAGDDFAVALTYDGDLFAWSLLDKSDGKNGGNVYGLNVGIDGNPAGNSLGEYYPSTPIRIDPNLTGIRYSTTYVNNGTYNIAGEVSSVLVKVGESYGAQDAESTSTEYIGYKSDSDPDKIVQIAATSTTAAFITEKNLIYTWGKDGEESRGGKLDSSMNLLLREGPTANYKSGHNFIPNIVNYYNTDAIADGRFGLVYMLPFGSLFASKQGFASKLNTIYSSDNNYIINYQQSESATSGAEHYSRANVNYVWGQTVYNQQNSSGVKEFVGNDIRGGNVTTTGERISVINSLNVYLGDGNVYYVDLLSGNLNVRGKNYVVPYTAGDKDFTVSTADGTNYTVTGSAGAIISNTFVTATADNSANVAVYVTSKAAGSITEATVTRGFQPIGNVSGGLTDSQKVSLYSSADMARETSEYSVNSSTFSAANGYGYLIGGDKKVYFWGDSHLGQSGTKQDTPRTLVEIGDAGVAYEQVVAGKVKSGAPIVEGLGDNWIPSAAGGGCKKWASKTEPAQSEGGGYTDGAYKLASAYFDGNSYISAMLDSTGKLKLIGALDGESFVDATAVNDKLKACGVFNAQTGTVYNRVATIVGGYGNNLFVLSTLGKIYRIHIAGTVTGGTLTADNIVCDVYDVFTDNGATADNHKVISNWEIGSRNSVEFKKGYNDADGKSKVAATVELSDDKNRQGGVKAAKADVSTSDSDLTEYVNCDPSNVINWGASKSGDAYRMILPIAQKKAVVDDKTTGYVDISGVSTDFDGKISGIVSGQKAADGIGKLEFYWSTDTNQQYPIPDDVAFRYFDIAYNYTVTDNVPDISFTVTPIRSTMGKSIIIKYWLGRYDSVANFAKLADGTNYSASDLAFYDFKQAELSVKIGDTEFEQVYRSKKSDYENTLNGNDACTIENSTVPLLDPNNPFNNMYSIALMDVSSGFDAVLAELEANKVALPANAKDDLLQRVATADEGFPANSRIAKGSILYYNSDAAQYYNDKYVYFAKDHDGDIITYQSSAVGSTPDYDDYFTYETRTRTVFLPFATGTNGVELTLDSTEAQLRSIIAAGQAEDATAEQINAGKSAELTLKLKNLFEKTTENGEVLRFDNMYGLTMRLSREAEAYGISISYEVLTVTAVKSMGGDTATRDYVTYTERDISSPVTALHGSQTINMLRPRLTDGNLVNKTFDNGDGSDASVRRAVEVFTQSSLTLKSRSADSVYNAVGEHEIYGAPLTVSSKENKTNTYTYGKITLNLGMSGVGSWNGAKELGEYSVDISEFFDDDSNIRIAYNGSTATNDVEKYIDTFGDSNAVGLSEIDTTSFKIAARRKTPANNPFVFEITLRRNLPGSNTELFSYKDTSGEAPQNVPAEEVHIRFEVDVKFTAAFSKLDNATKEWDDLVDANTKVPMSSFINTTPSVWNTYGNVSVSSYSPSVVTAYTVKQDNMVYIKFNPLTSGTAYIHYEVTLFDEAPISGDLKISVVALTTMSDITIIDDKHIYVSDMESYINRVNKLDNEKLELKPGSDGKPFYFEYRPVTVDDSGNSVLGDWQPKTVETDGATYNALPDFLSDAYMGGRDNSEYLWLKMGEYSSTEAPETARVVVMFTDSTKTKDYRVAITVAPAAQTLRDVNAVKDGINVTSNFGISIDKGAGSVAIINRVDGVADAANEGMERSGDYYSIPVTALAKLMYGVRADEIKDYRIVSVQVINNTVNNYDCLEVTTNFTENATAILLKPLYPTGNSECTVQVSVVNSRDNNSGVVLLSFVAQVTGIKTTLTAKNYQVIILTTFFSVLALLIIVFFIRMGIYWKKKAEQRRIIKKNQTLIKMRDKMHSKTETVSKEKLVRTKLKMEDPKYAKMFNDMRQQKEAQTGIVLDNSVVAQKAENKEKASKEAKKKKKGGKRSIEELQAELAAKRDAVARMQAGDFTDMPEGMAPADGMPPVADIPVDAPVVDEVPVFDPSEGFEGMSATQIEDDVKASIGVDDVVIEPVVPDDNSNEG